MSIKLAKIVSPVMTMDHLAFSLYYLSRVYCLVTPATS